MLALTLLLFSEIASKLHLGSIHLLYISRIIEITFPDSMGKPSDI